MYMKILEDKSQYKGGTRDENYEKNPESVSGILSAAESSAIICNGG